VGGVSGLFRGSIAQIIPGSRAARALDGAPCPIPSFVWVGPDSSKIDSLLNWAAFTIRATDSYAGLKANWDHAWEILFATLTELEPGDLSRTVTIRGEGLSVLQAITGQLTHYAYHVGQIVYLAQRIAGPKWKSLSIPLGKSADFNRKPERYL
jgi:hypothetical protein